MQSPELGKHETAPTELCYLQMSNTHHGSDYLDHSRAFPRLVSIRGTVVIEQSTLLVSAVLACPV